MDNTEINIEKHKLLFGVRRSIRYHHRRRLFFDRLHKWSAFLSALSGSATIASVLATAPRAWTISFALAVAVFSIVDLVIGTAQAARLHNDLAKRFINLEKSIITLNKPSDEEINHPVAQRLDIETDEPPPLKVLDSICHNELLRAMDYPLEDFVKIRWYQRLLSQIIDIRGHTIHPISNNN